ncbi:MAG TPA: PASTA domain-containing protein [Solirubrobacteraceae bacterium]|nr:PASTA domain-containing protein [Solirubrobacteraceae bacterium]
MPRSLPGVLAGVVWAVACAALVAGCGGGDGPPAPPTERVRLQISAPADGATVRGGTADVRGSVSPRASAVSVLGRPALVSDGRFSVVVPLDAGTNVIDVMATAPRRLPAMTALRVTRDILVTVPDLTGLLEDELDARLDPLGLGSDVERGGGLFDVLRPGQPVVCRQAPPAGARVRRGREVQVVVAKRC